MRPGRIDQIIPSIVEHDAVSNHTFAAQRLLREMGFLSDIYAANIGPGTEGRVEPLGDLPRLGPDHQWVLYQCSIGSPAARTFANHPGYKLLDYHNITPTHLVERFLPGLGAETRLGRSQLAQLAGVVGFALADSPFNAAELDDLGYAPTRVVPVLIDAANLDQTADERLRAQLFREMRSGGRRWLFVGQLAPHKAQHDVIKAFDCYRRCFDPLARLSLVGREMGSAYRAALELFIESLDLTDSIDLVGSVPPASLAAYYEASDVFVCCSDHEGFCAPLIEAMARSLPVVAYGAAAVPGTVGDAGVLLDSKAPAVVAASVAEMLATDRMREELVARGHRRAALFSLANAEEAFRHAVLDALTDR